MTGKFTKPRFLWPWSGSGLATRCGWTGRWPPHAGNRTRGTTGWASGRAATTTSTTASTRTSSPSTRRTTTSRKNRRSTASATLYRMRRRGTLRVSTRRVKGTSSQGGTRFGNPMAACASSPTLRTPSTGSTLSSGIKGSRTLQRRAPLRPRRKRPQGGCRFRRTLRLCQKEKTQSCPR
ncbi:hypothetical protein FOCC_FOCC002202 [Frankliniella occidentalis]|nr:hypothetical protein FOCC_FOCC002202 [Frankliniella occidentalis]